MTITDIFLKSIADIKFSDMDCAWKVFSSETDLGQFRFGDNIFYIRDISFHKNNKYDPREKEEMLMRACIRSGNTSYWCSIAMELHGSIKMDFSLNDFLENLSKENALCDFEMGASRVFFKDYKKGKISNPSFEINENCFISEKRIFHQHSHRVIENEKNSDSYNEEDSFEDYYSYNSRYYGQRHLKSLSKEQKDKYLDLSLDKYISLLKPEVAFDERHGLIFGEAGSSQFTNYSDGGINCCVEKDIYGIYIRTRSFPKERKDIIFNAIKAKYLKNNQWDFGKTNNNVFDFFTRIKKEISFFIEEVEKNDKILV